MAGTSDEVYDFLADHIKAGLVKVLLKFKTNKIR